MKRDKQPIYSLGGHKIASPGPRDTTTKPGTRRRRTGHTRPPVYRVKFVYDTVAEFEECNGEARPLTEEEYADNEYYGCPKHPRGFQGTKERDTSVPGYPGRGMCVCGTVYEPIPYDEYLAYYGNPERHVYLGCVVEREKRCTCGESVTWEPVASLWHIDVMDDDTAYTGTMLDVWYTGAEAAKLPAYVGDVARELLQEAGHVC